MPKQQRMRSVCVGQQVSKNLVHCTSTARLLQQGWIVSSSPLPACSELTRFLIANTTEHKRNHIMGQTRGDVFRFYVNQIVDVDTQSIFLETPSRNALLKLSSNSGLTRDPSAPQHLNDEQKNSIRKSPEILELKNQRDRSRKGIIAKYGKIGLSRGTPEHTEYNMIMREFRAKRKQLEKATLDQTYEEFFNNIGNQVIEANFQGNPLCFTPQTSTVLPERKELADLEFKTQTRAQSQTRNYWKTALNLWNYVCIFIKSKFHDPCRHVSQ